MCGSAPRSTELASAARATVVRHESRHRGGRRGGPGERLPPERPPPANRLRGRSTLGGHVRTLNGNVPCEILDPRLFLDAGVVEFDEHHFPTLGRLLDELKVERRPAPGLHGAVPRRRDGASALRETSRSEAVADSNALRPERACFLWPSKSSASSGEPRAFHLRTSTRVSIGDYLGTGTYATWLRLLLMYAYSIPYRETAAIPAALAVPVLRAFTGHREIGPPSEAEATSICVRIAEAIEARLVLDARIESISRPPGGVTIRLQTGEALEFDAVVLAAPPDQVLKLLSDATPAERRCFSNWRANHMRTVGPHGHGPLRPPRRALLLRVRPVRGPGWKRRLQRLPEPAFRAPARTIPPTTSSPTDSITRSTPRAWCTSSPTTRPATPPRRCATARRCWRPRASAARSTPEPGSVTALHEGAVASAVGGLPERLGGRRPLTASAA